MDQNFDLITGNAAINSVVQAGKRMTKQEAYIIGCVHLCALKAEVEAVAGHEPLQRNHENVQGNAYDWVGLDS